MACDGLREELATDTSGGGEDRHLHRSILCWTAIGYRLRLHGQSISLSRRMRCSAWPR